MSSTQEPTDSTPTAQDPSQPEPPPAPATEPEPEPETDGEDDGTETDDGAEGDDEGSEPVDAEGIKVEVEMMLYEAGMIANSLSSKQLGSALADKLFAAEQQAESAGESRFTFGFTPFEAGMALGSMGRVVDNSLDRLKNSLGQALGEIMEDLNIPPLGDQGGAVGGGL